MGAIGETIGGITAPLIGFFGVLVVFLTFEAQRKANRIQAEMLAQQINGRKTQVDECTSKLEVSANPTEGGGLQLQVRNNSDYAIHNVKALITISYDLNDVLTDLRCWIGEGNVVPCVEESVCWSERVDGKYVATSDIYSSDVRNLSLFRFQDKQFARSAYNSRAQQSQVDTIAVASFEGYGPLDGVGFESCKARVRLRNKKYFFWVKLVSEDTRARVWEFKFCEDQKNSIEKLGEISVDDLKGIEVRIRAGELIGAKSQTYIGQ